MSFGAKIDIKKSHNLSIEKVRNIAENIASDIAKEYNINWLWNKSKDIIKFDAKSGAAKGLHGELSVTPSSIRIVINLPFILYAAHGSIEKCVKDKMNDLFIEK
jgi:putative polyhydroxyalkanoate system protein